MSSRTSSRRRRRRRFAPRPRYNNGDPREREKDAQPTSTWNAVPTSTNDGVRERRRGESRREERREKGVSLRAGGKAPSPPPARARESRVVKPSCTRQTLVLPPYTQLPDRERDPNLPHVWLTLGGLTKGREMSSSFPLVVVVPQRHTFVSRGGARHRNRFTEPSFSLVLPPSPPRDPLPRVCLLFARPINHRPRYTTRSHCWLSSSADTRGAPRNFYRVTFTPPPPPSSEVEERILIK